MDEKGLEKSDRSKYGDKNFDLIAENYRISKHRGDIWCAENIKRYLNRYTRPESSKANNHVDLLKAKNYLERMIEISGKSPSTQKEEKVETIVNLNTNSEK